MRSISPQRGVDLVVDALLLEPLVVALDGLVQVEVVLGLALQGGVALILSKGGSERGGDGERGTGEADLEVGCALLGRGLVVHDGLQGLEVWILRPDVVAVVPKESRKVRLRFGIGLGLGGLLGSRVILVVGEDNVVSFGRRGHAAGQIHRRRLDALPRGNGDHLLGLETPSDFHGSCRGGWEGVNEFALWEPNRISSRKAPARKPLIISPRSHAP